MTFVATTWAISYVGARPVFVDVDPVTYTMDLRHVGGRSHAVPGRSCRFISTVSPPTWGRCWSSVVAGAFRLSKTPPRRHGARYNGQGAGTLGLCGCFSFYPGKNLGAYGEAGEHYNRRCVDRRAAPESA